MSYAANESQSILAVDVGPQERFKGKLGRPDVSRLIQPSESQLSCLVCVPLGGTLESFVVSLQQLRADLARFCRHNVDPNNISAPTGNKARLHQAVDTRLQTRIHAPRLLEVRGRSPGLLRLARHTLPR